MNDDVIYIIDTSSLIDIFHHHPQDIYSEFWKKFTEYMDTLLMNGRLILLDCVLDEVDKYSGKIEGKDDPAVIWIKERSKYLIESSYDFSILKKIGEILEKFPQSGNKDKVPPAADSYLIAYVLHQRLQSSILDEREKRFVIVTEEKRNDKNFNMEKLRQQKGKIVEITKIPSICDYYEIGSMKYQEMFRVEGWKF